MNFHNWNVLSSAATALACAALISACNESPSAPPSTSAEARADLQALAGKVKYFAAPGAPEDMALGAEKHGAGKKSARALEDVCIQEGLAIEEGQETSQYGGDLDYWDTTLTYTAANKLVCGEDDVPSYEISNSRNQDSQWESWFTTRFTYPANFMTGDFKLTGNGWVRYTDGYYLTVTAIDLVFNINNGIKKYTMTLALEKGYGVVLAANPAIDMMSDEEPGPNEIVASGPITKDGLTVGYFELMGDDRVIIRDAQKAVIDAHG